MTWPFVLRSRYDDARAEADRQRDRADKHEKRADTAVFNRQQIARQLMEADAANRRLAGRNIELGRQISQLTEAGPDHLIALENRVARLHKVGARILAAYQTRDKEATALAAKADESDTKVKNLRAQLHAWETRASTTNPEKAWEARPVDGAPASRDESTAAQLGRAQEHARALERQLAEMTIANHKCNCQRPLAQEGSTAA